jgi:hypothetical protein
MVIFFNWWFANKPQDDFSTFDSLMMILPTKIIGKCSALFDFLPANKVHTSHMLIIASGNTYHFKSVLLDMATTMNLQ